MIIDDWFMQMWQGNQVAWLAFGLVIVVVGLMSMLGIIWWKTPQPAKKMLLNNLHGGGKPIVANAYDDQKVRFETPQIFKEGVLYDKKGGWFFVPRLTQEANDVLGSDVNKEVFTKAFRVEGTNSAFYSAYSGKGTIVNSELQAIIEQERILHPAKNNPGMVTIDKQAFISAIEKIKDKQIIVDPVHVTTFLDPRKIKEYLPKAFTKSQLLAQEHKVREMMRNMQEGMGAKGIMVLLVIILIVNILGLVKSFGVF